MTMEIRRTGQIHFNFFRQGREFSASVAAIGVSPANGQGPLWWVVSKDYSETWLAQGRAELITEKHDEAPKELLSSFGGRLLSGFSYGEVPDGFQQLTPEHGRPRAMRRGARYVLHVWSEALEAFEFEF